MGNRHSGLDVIAGKIHLAPCDAEVMHEIVVAETGLSNLIRTLNADFAERFSVLAQRRAAWWRDLGDNIGIDIFDETLGIWTYRNGVVVHNPPAPKADK